MTARHSDKQPVSTVDICRDIELAQYLAPTYPTGAAACGVRERLGQYIQALAGPAEAHVRAMPRGRPRDVAEDTIRHARTLIAEPGTDPRAALCLRAGVVRHLLRYAGRTT